MYKSMEQIEKEYDGQWVFMINCQQGQYGRILGGEVVLHEKKMGDVSGKMNEVDGERGISFIGYIGEIPKDVFYLWQIH